jgi:hypothetical protein
MIGIADKTRQAEAFYQVARDMIRLIHFKRYDVFSDIVDTSYMNIGEIEKYFEKNPDLLPDNPYEKHIIEKKELYRINKVNDLTYDIEYDLVHNTNIGYMTMCVQFIHDAVEPYTTVEIKNFRKN